MREQMVCPVCGNDCGHVSKDGGDVWNCDVCQGYHDGEQRTKPNGEPFGLTGVGGK